MIFIGSCGVRKRSLCMMPWVLVAAVMAGCTGLDGQQAASTETQTLTINGVDFEVSASYRMFDWQELPADLVIERQPVQAFTNPDGETHYYEAIHLPSGNLNWFQAACLAEQAGGYLASITSQEENAFVFGLVSDEKYFWHFPPYDGSSNRMNHHEISIGPFLGGYQPEGSAEPRGGWSWLSGEPWEYSNWAVNLDDGVIDQDPRDNTQPNDSGNSRDGQRVMGFGEMNRPVSTWGDYMDDVGSYGMKFGPGHAYGFVIEYESQPDIQAQ